MFEELLYALRADPQNRSGRHKIKKLIDVKRGDGQWRIRSGVYRLRYDIDGQIVTLHSISHRRDAY
jgi:mRNA-degrading endonuclease RelE of RelBE toxin-antitoxin system